MEQDSFVAQFGREVYPSGSTVSALIFAKFISEKTRENSVCYIQAHGHVIVSERWTKLASSTSDIFPQQSSFPLDQNVTLPKRSPLFSSDSINFKSSNYRPVCFFLTPRESISHAQLLTGILAQFELPIESLPSYKGLSASIIYTLSLVVQLQSCVKHFDFPFHISSRGIERIPQEIRVAALSLFPCTSLSSESILLGTPSTAQSMIDEQSMEMSTGSEPSFVWVDVISDKDTVCKLSHPSCIYLGDTISLSADFIESSKSCSIMRARLILCEKRSDGSRVQDKVIDSVTRHIPDAVHVRLRLKMSPFLPCTFVSPVVQVSYKIDVEFFAQQVDLHWNTSTISRGKSGSSGMSSSNNPFTWSTNLPVHSKPAYIFSRGEAVACLESSAFSMEKVL